MSARKTTPLHIRFKSKLSAPNANGCILFTGGLDRRGYGKIGDGTRATQRILGAHRVAWELAHGEIPSGMSVLHKCDVPACVNPEHLFLGTQLDNVKDMDSKGRGAGRFAEGTRPKNTKLDDATVREIRERCARGERKSDIAKRFSIGWTTVSHIVLRENWRHVS